MVLLNNRYQIIKSLGRGGFGETFLAVDTHMPSARQCVIKLLKPVIDTPQIPAWLQERFQREAIVLEELGENHPQIPRLYAYFTEQGNFYLVQEWIEGVTLTQCHEQRGNFSSEEVQDLLIELLPVLDFVHQRRIIHRDIKPDNIILRSRDNQPILIDFGVIKEAMGTVVSPDGKTAYSIALGTPGYMASEQAAGRPVYSSDLYSLGLTAIFLLTGKTPQYLETDSRTGEFRWRQYAPQVAPHLAEVLDRCIRFHPRDRFASAREMLRALVSRIPEMTAATLVVAPENSRSPNRPAKVRQPVTSGEEEEESGSNAFVTWFVLPLLFLLVIVGGLSVGFLFASKRRAVPVPSPEPSQDIVPPSPQIEPSPVFTATPTPIPTPPPATPVPTPPPATPTPIVPVTPSPLESPSPAIEPTIEVTTVPLVSPTPDIPIPTSPMPETPTPQATPTVTVTPTPSPPVPEISPPAPPAEEKPATPPPN
ncbi:MAG: protein kinase [Merismopediaceae bacterium]|nr:protein kinase [Merismopediaceae bacterium]